MSKPEKNIDKLFFQAQKHHQARQFTRARQIYHQILEESPQHPDALNLLGTAFAQEGELKEAIKFIMRAIAYRPDLAPYRVNLGVVFQDLGEFDMAEECYQQAIKIDKKFCDAHYNLAKLYKQIGKPYLALKTYQNLLLLNPERQDALINLGNIYFDDGALEKAVKYFKKACLINSGNEQLIDQAIINLANTYRRKGDDIAAIQTYDHILSRNFYAGIRIKQAITLPIVYRDNRHIADVRRRFEREIIAIMGSQVSVEDPALEISSTNFFLAYQAMSNKKLQQQIAQIMLKACPALDFIAPHCELTKAPKKKIKIGFISGYFRRHSIGILMQGLIQNISKDEFEIIILTPRDHKDPTALNIHKNADKVVIFSDDTFKAQGIIAAEELDILFYADIGMDIRTYFLAFSRLARVQCVTWGHPDTTGIPNMDYFISSNLIEPKNAEDHYSEALYKLKTLPTFYYAINASNSIKSKSEFGCPSDMTLYLCPQSVIKHHPDMDFIFSKIIKADDKAMIMIVEGAVADWTKQIQARWKKNIPDECLKIKIIPRQSPDNFIALQNAADVILDTPHFSGGNTSLDAFALGKPVVTHDGDFMRGRVTAGMYRMMGIDTFIAKSLNEYVTIALKLGLDKTYRDALSRKIKKSNKVLYENTEVINEFETFFKSLFSND